MSAAQIDGPSFGFHNPGYEARIRRAQELAAKYPFAAEVLGFYRQLASFQHTFYKQLRAAATKQPALIPADPFRSSLDLVPLMPQFPEFLHLLESAGTPQIAEAARRLSVQGAAAWIAFLGDFWSAGRLQRQGSGESGEDESAANGTLESGSQSAEFLTAFILRAFLTPCAELFAPAAPVASQSAGTQDVCPRCDSAPLVGVLRREGDGAKRFLLCSFCLQEWDYRRILCPACGETEERKLPVYVAEQFPHIRVETCETCKSYIRSIDLTKDGHASPIVDDLAAIPLSLWAAERGYTRLQPNLLSI